MKKSILFSTMSLCMTIYVYAQDWSGISVPANAGAGKIWQLQSQHSDDFNYNGKNATFNGKWLDNHRAGWSGPGETQFSSNHSDVSGGSLLIKAGRVTNISGKTVYCGHVTTKTPVIYPVFTEVRMRCSGINLSSNFWLLSADDVNEIDVTETYGAEDPNGRKMATNYHIFQRSPFRDLANSPKKHTSQGNVFLRNDFHRFGLYWKSATEFEFYFDGVLVRQLNRSNDLRDPRNRFFDQAMHIIMNTELHTWKSNAGIRPSNQELNNNNINKMYFDWIRTYKPVTGTVTQGPYNGNINTIPGTIQAEHYDVGGADVAYSDNTSGNSGNQLRTDDVDVEVSGEGGHNIGWVAAGEWLEYTVDVANSGTYDIDFRTASLSNGGTIHVEIDGEDVTGAVTLPVTGAWQTYQTTTKTGVSLSEGEHVMRLSLDASGFNLNWVKFTSIVTNIPVTGVSTSPSSLSLAIGQTSPLSAVVSPSNATNPALSWSTSNVSVATVNASGVVTAIGTGTASVSATTADGGFTDNTVVTVSSTPGTQQAYPSGVPHAIPGSIESVNFDTGGEDVAYNDLGAGNNGTGIRQDENVDTENRIAAGNVGWIATGEWLEYTVNVTQAGNYKIDILTASTGSNGAFHVEFGGVDKTGVQNVASTGDWGVFNTITMTGVSLSAGVQVMRIYIDGGSFNLGTITISSETTTPQTVTLTPVSDSYLQGSTNFNNELVRLENGNRVGYLKYDLSSITGPITDAALKFTVTGDVGNGNLNVNLGSSNSWNETNLSNANKPAASTLLGSINEAYAIGNIKTVSLQTGSISGNEVSLVLIATSGNDFAIASKENTGATAPQLVITYQSGSTRAGVDESMQSLSAYPNPVSGDSFTLDLSSYENEALIRIIDQTGHVVFETTTSEDSLSISTDVLSSVGVYIIGVTGNNKTEMVKLIVQ